MSGARFNISFFYHALSISNIHHVTVSPDWPVVRPGDMWDHDEAIGQMDREGQVNDLTDGSARWRSDRWNKTTRL